MSATRGFVHCDTFVTKVAGYQYHATAPPAPGAPVEFVREPENAFDTNAVAIHDAAGRRLGYLFREVAAEWAALIDHGAVRLGGRLIAPGEPGYDATLAPSNLGVYV